jgi:hypothetical protein
LPCPREMSPLPPVAGRPQASRLEEPLSLVQRLTHAALRSCEPVLPPCWQWAGCFLAPGCSPTTSRQVFWQAVSRIPALLPPSQPARGTRQPLALLEPPPAQGSHPHQSQGQRQRQRRSRGQRQRRNRQRQRQRRNHRRQHQRRRRNQEPHTPNREESAA